MLIEFNALTADFATGILGSHKRLQLYGTAQALFDSERVSVFRHEGDEYIVKRANLTEALEIVGDELVKDVGAAILSLGSFQAGLLYCLLFQEDFLAQ